MWVLHIPDPFNRNNMLTIDTRYRRDTRIDRSVIKLISGSIYM